MPVALLPEVIRIGESGPYISILHQQVLCMNAMISHRFKSLPCPSPSISLLPQDMSKILGKVCVLMNPPHPLPSGGGCCWPEQSLPALVQVEKSVDLLIHTADGLHFPFWAHGTDDGNGLPDGDICKRSEQCADQPP